VGPRAGVGGLQNNNISLQIGYVTCAAELHSRAPTICVSTWQVTLVIMPDCFNGHNKMAPVSFHYNKRHNYLDNARSHYQSNWFSTERVRLQMARLWSGLR